MSLGDETFQVRCPTLLGAILLKTRAIRCKQRVQDCDDLVVLLSCVDDPLDLRSQLQGGESGRLRASEAPLGLDEAGLRDRFDPAPLEGVRAAFRILSG